LSRPHWAGGRPETLPNLPANVNRVRAGHADGARACALSAAVDTQGDAFFVAFVSARDAVAVARLPHDQARYEERINTHVDTTSLAFAAAYER
jgi:hypothetical protein